MQTGHPTGSNAKKALRNLDEPADPGFLRNQWARASKCFQQSPEVLILSHWFKTEYTVLFCEKHLTDLFPWPKKLLITGNELDRSALPNKLLYTFLFLHFTETTIGCYWLCWSFKQGKCWSGKQDFHCSKIMYKAWTTVTCFPLCSTPFCLQDSKGFLVIRTKKLRGKKNHKKDQKWQIQVEEWNTCFS